MKITEMCEDWWNSQNDKSLCQQTKEEMYASVAGSNSIYQKKQLKSFAIEQKKYIFLLFVDNLWATKGSSCVCDLCPSNAGEK